MRKTILIIALMIVACGLSAQEGGATLKPDYRKVARVVKSPRSQYFLDSLQERFLRCDTALTVDDLRCLYFGGGEVSLSDAWRRYQLLLGRFGRHGGKANDAWWQYQMLLTAVWSTGDGTRRKPLHVRSHDDAVLAAKGYDTELWFKVKGRRKFAVAP